MIKADALVVGGGLTGLAAAIAVARTGRDTVHLAPRAPTDRRTSALMGPSVAYLRAQGLIGDPDAIGHALRGIRIIDATGRLIRAPETLFRAGEAGLDAFGWNFPNARLLEAFAAAGRGVATLRTIEAPLRSLERGWMATLPDGSRIEAPLVVGADGKQSLVRAAAGIPAREHVFGQAALVCDLTLGRPIGDTSVEFHYPRGPFTLVPAGGPGANLVWIDDSAALAEARVDPDLPRILRERAQRLFGAVEVRTPPVVFPLSTLSVETAGRDGVVLVGEAAHAFPPIGAQGLNLGLRDVADLGASLGAGEVSAAYAARRSGDLVRTGAMVDLMFRSLLSGFLPAQFARAAGLWALRLSPALRRQAFALGMGGR